MRLKGVLGLSITNFLCLRGFAPMGSLARMSEADESFQRKQLASHRKEMVAFLDQGDFTFFPEVILGTYLTHEDVPTEEVEKLWKNILHADSFVRRKFDHFLLSGTTYKTKRGDEMRSVYYFQTATLEQRNDSNHKFSRIDGNHRLSAALEKQKFERYNTPFCLVLFRTKKEMDKFSRALFHNINYKQIPLTMEQNLTLILDDKEGLFPDELLRENPSFGWHYYLARKLNNALDFDLLPNLRPFIEKEPRTFFVRQFGFLIKKKVLKESESAAKEFKEALGRVNTIVDSNSILKECKNAGILAAILYYELQKHPSGKSFVRWVIENHLYLIEDTNIDKDLQPDFIQIFDKILESKKHTIFVSMQYGKTETEEHYTTIERVCREINDAHPSTTPIKPQRVDWFHDGTSYRIDDKIEEMILDCGLFIGDLTFSNVNVYHEIGFVMGKARAEGKDSADMLLVLDKSVPEPDKRVGSNISSIKQLRFESTEKFGKDLKENIEKFYKLV